MLLTSWVLSKLDNYSFILKSLDPMMKCAWIAIYNISEQCSKRPHKRLIRFFLGFKSEKKFSGKKDVLDQLLPAFPVSHPQSCWSSLVQVRIITKQQKVKKTWCSVDKPVDAEAELAKEEMDHTATMQRIAQQVISGQSMH